ncbi:MAG TPA: amino acid adenylation domain-containing protein, partial [Armatimonadota bacterium]|nr:amino acid adenylation domain-containing protein [Armatimonadota bacterium]
MQHPQPLVLEEEGNALQARWEYNADHFSREAISRHSRHFLRLLNLVIEQTETPPAELPLLTEEEKAQLHVWNDTARPYPQERCLHEWIADQSARTPDAPAVLFETQSLTYRELDERANRLAHFLREHGVGPEVRVGLCLERSLELMIGLLGVLKAGGAYVPLDPSYPRERLVYMLADADCRILLTQAHLCDQLAEWADAELVCLDSEWPVIAACSPAPLHSGVSPQNAINVIFTSGSTGKPKGVVNTHRGLVNRLFWMQETYQLDSSDRVLQKTPISFDVAGWEFFWPLLCGATQVMARPEGHKDPQYLVDTIKRYAVTTLHFVPSMLQAFLLSERVEECTNLRRVICSGEALTPAHQQAFFARLGAELHNLYGPTEAAIDVSFWRCHPDSPYDVVPIGRPVANTRLYILDGRLQPVPVGVSGELYIGGVQVARGYLNRPDLTAERFIPNPLPAAPGERLYRTGDLARFLADGSIEYLGRIDHQVKVRGCRIELGEIEDALRKHADVRDAVVVAREFGPGDLRLVAYLVMAGGKQQPVSAWREHLGQTLPDYMLPAAYVYLEALPLSPNGKLDRKALPAPENAHTESAVYVPPRTPAEKMLASIWQELLGIPRVGLFDHFFHLGGHSLLAARLVSHVAARFGKEIPLRLVFEHPTLDSMAAQLAGTGNDTGRSASAPMLPRERNDQNLPLSFTQERLWFLDRLLPQSAMYNIPMVLHLQGPLDVGAMERALSLLVARHEALRTTIHETGGNPYQVVAAAAPVSLPLIDLSAEAPAEREEAKIRLELTEASAPFTLSEGPLWRTKLVRLAPEDHLLLWTMHHIITDGWSLSVLGEDLAHAYNDFVTGRTADFPALPLQYADYALWQREQYRADRIAEPLAYWRKQLAGLETLQLPTDHPRPAVSGHRGAREPVCIPEALCRRLREMCLALDVTPFMAMLAVFQTVLSRWSGQDDIAVGSPVGNRSHVETERVVGFFANTLVLRGDLSGSPSFRSLLTRVREMCLEAYAHQDVPIEMLVSDLKPLRDLSQNPLFQVMFVLQNATTREFGFQGMRVVPELPPVTVAKFDLTLDLAEADGAIKGVLEYSADLFTPATARRLTEHYLR